MATTTPKTTGHSSIHAAIAAFQAEVPTIRKSNEAVVNSQKGSYKYAYADLSDVTEKVMPLLGKHGLAFTARPTFVDEAFVLAYELRHESGETIEGTYPLPSPNTPPQQLGSAITYARRYALTAVTGVAPGGDDDDAQTAQQNAANARQPRPAAHSRENEAPRVQLSEDEWIARLNGSKTLDDAVAVWRESRGNAPAEVTDKLAILCQEWKLAEEERAVKAASATPDHDPQTGEIAEGATA